MKSNTSTESINTTHTNSPKKSVTDRIKAAIPWLRANDQAEEKLFDMLREKAGQDIAFPSYPVDEMLFWLQARHQTAPEDSPSRYKIVYEDLLVIQRLFASDALQNRRRALRATLSTSLWAGSSLKDESLRAQILETFALPHLDAAYAEQWESMSVERILGHAYAAYQGSGNGDKAERMLRVMVSFASRPSERDWARTLLAEKATQKNKFQEAIALLQSLETPEMSGNKTLIPGLQKRLKEQQNQPKNPQDKT